jgi:hypothetical protein
MKSKPRGTAADRMEQNETIATRYLNEQEFESVAFNELVRRIYEDLKKTG